MNNIVGDSTSPCAQFVGVSFSAVSNQKLLESITVSCVDLANT
jgi:hypothetical protein